MTQPMEKYDALESSYHRVNAAPVVFPNPKYQLGALLKDDDGDYVQIIGLEWCLIHIDKAPYWKYVIWDIALGCVLDIAESALDLYTLS